MALTSLRPWRPGRGVIGYYPEINAPGAVVDICGVFLNERGEPVQAKGVSPLGRLETLMRCDELKMIADYGQEEYRKDRSKRRGEVIVVCGYSEDRLGSLAAAVRGGLINTLITDAKTREVLQSKCLEEQT